jgi:NADH:ubiquinone oxidoreductase subunit
MLSKQMPEAAKPLARPWDNPHTSSHAALQHAVSAQGSVSVQSTLNFQIGDFHDDR